MKTKLPWKLLYETDATQKVLVSLLPFCVSVYEIEFLLSFDEKRVSKSNYKIESAFCWKLPHLHFKARGTW